jgi:very-short-patch-repair endonuclease
MVARWQLARDGISAEEIKARLGRGTLYRIHPGVYAVGHRDVSPDGRLMAAVLAAGPGAVLSHRSAGRVWGMVRWGGVVEVTRPRKFRGREGIRCHRSTLREDEWVFVDGLPVTSIFRTLIDLAAVLDRQALSAALNEMEVRGLTDAVRLDDLIARHAGRRGIANLVGVLQERRPSGVARNEFEQSFVQLVEASGLPRPRLNADLHVRGRFVEIDALWESQRLAVELDGRAVHGTGASFESDRKRDRLLLSEGYRTMRITWRQLRDEPDPVLSDLRQALK